MTTKRFSIPTGGVGGSKERGGGGRVKVKGGGSDRFFVSADWGPAQERPETEEERKERKKMEIRHERRRQKAVLQGRW